MASRSLTVAALRHRPLQALLIVVLSAVVTASAALGPLYAREVEQSVLRTVLVDASPSARGVVVTSAGNRPPAPGALVRQASAGVGQSPTATDLFGRPVGGAEVDVLARGVRGVGSARLVFRDGACAHLTLLAGSCPRARDQVLVSARTAEALDVSTGSVLLLVESSDRKQRLRVTVTGVYEPYAAATNYWMDRQAGANRSNLATEGPPPVDALFTPWSTLGSRTWNELHSYADVPLLPQRLGLESVAAIRSATVAIDRQVRGVTASATSGLPDLLGNSARQRSQAREIVPLLAIQLALLGVVVLGFVCAAATEQRRPQIALARLRGQGASGATQLLVAELGSLVLVGTALGALGGWLAARAAAARWLADGVVPELRWPVLVAVAAAAMAGLIALLVAALPTLRQPVVTLLRRVPPRGSARPLGLVEGALVAAAGAGLVTLLAGRVSGPVALLAPGLLAISGGLLLASAVVPVAARVARAALDRGKLVTALAGTQVARRPALRRLIAIIAVACALLVFAVDTLAVADRNRSLRASVEAGAPVVLTVDAANAETLRQAVLAEDPRADFATPVVTSLSATDEGPRTTAVDPRSFARIASWGSDSTARPSGRALGLLPPEPVRPVRLQGTETEVTASFTGEVVPEVDEPPPPLRPFTLRLQVSDGRGGLVGVDLGRLRRGTATYRAPLPCPDGCDLQRIVLGRSPGDLDAAAIRLEVRDVRSGANGDLTSADLGPAGQESWQPLVDTLFGTADFTVFVKPPLTIAGTVYTGPFVAQRGNLPAVPAVLATRDVPTPSRQVGQALTQVVAPGLGLRDQTYSVAGRIRHIPRTGARGVLVDLSSLAAVAGAPGSRTTYAVWLASDDAEREQRLVSGLARHGVVVTARDTEVVREAQLAREGTANALRLALLAGLVAVVLAGAVLVVGVATSGSARATDLAALRVVGVPAALVRLAAVREHLVVALLGVLSGATLGLVAAQIALPQIPLFARSNRAVPVAHDPAWVAVAAAAVGCLLLLGLVSVLVGRALAASATPDRLREHG